MLTPRRLILLATMGTVLALAVAVVALYDRLRHEDHGGLEATMPADSMSAISPAAGPPGNNNKQPPKGPKKPD